MTMTPEREKEIRELRQQTMSQVGTPTMYIIALRKGLDNLLAAYDTITAEIATLKQALSGRTVSCECCNATSAENERLKGEVERLRDQSDYLSDRLETVSAAAEHLLSKVFQVHADSGTTYSIPPYGAAQKIADTAFNDLKRALGHKV